MENGIAPKQPLLSWDKLLAHESSMDDDGFDLCQAIEWYGWTEPTKFQAVAIPCITQACRNDPDARSYVLLQAAAGLGKTSALAVGLLAAVRRQTRAGLQFIVLALDACNDIKRYLSSLGAICPTTIEYFQEALSPDIGADVAAAEKANVIVGHPSRIRDVLRASKENGVINLEAVDALIMDNASAMIQEGLNETVCEINQMLSFFVQRPMRYVVLSAFMEREAKASLRALKSSLMSKKNMFDIKQQVGRIRKLVKHYKLQGEPGKWIQMLSKLREMIYIPRAVIFCDNEEWFNIFKKRLTQKGTVVRAADGSIMSFSVLDHKVQTESERRESLRSFCKEQTDFLLTRSEANIFQASLPRVFFVIHFGVDASNLPIYGYRLLCLDSTIRTKEKKNIDHNGVSLLFMQPPVPEAALQRKTPGPVVASDCTAKIAKTFGIKFEELPFGDLL
jgi:superfamily II DNA/RNA helicase